MKPKLNIKLLRQIQKAILSHPDQFMMHNVFSAQLEDGGVAGGCGTAACIAGWAIHLSNGKETIRQTSDKLRLRRWSWGTSAARLIGLNAFGSDKLFFEDCWPVKFKARYYRAKTNSGRAKAAAARIDHLIKTGK